MALRDKSQPASAAGAPCGCCYWQQARPADATGQAQPPQQAPLAAAVTGKSQPAQQAPPAAATGQAQPAQQAPPAAAAAAAATGQSQPAQSASQGAAAATTQPAQAALATASQAAQAAPATGDAQAPAPTTSSPDLQLPPPPPAVIQCDICGQTIKGDMLALRARQTTSSRCAATSSANWPTACAALMAAQEQSPAMMRGLCSSTRCTAKHSAHVRRTTRRATGVASARGQIKISPATGKASAGKIPPRRCSKASSSSSSSSSGAKLLRRGAPPLIPAAGTASAGTATTGGSPGSPATGKASAGPGMMRRTTGGSRGDLAQRRLAEEKSMFAACLGIATLTLCCMIFRVLGTIWGSSWRT